jgi:hypothetical protein
MTDTFREPAKVVADILAHELELDVQHITLNDEKWNIPKDKGLFIHLSYIGPNKPIANSNELDTSVTPPLEVQSVTAMDTVQIDSMSYDSSARTRKHEIGMALGSIYSQQAQERYQCQIALLNTPPVDTSSLEGTGMLKRFTTTTNVTALFKKSKVAEYFATIQEPEIELNK